MQSSLSPASQSAVGPLRSISDDDLCSDCGHCLYAPGESSGCTQGWPGHFPTQGQRADYCVTCPSVVQMPNKATKVPHA